MKSRDKGLKIQYFHIDFYFSFATMRSHLFAIDNIMSRQISFDVSARTAKLIGKENFANANGAVIELIKNSYDADATVAMVVFYKDALYIIDN